MFTPRPLFNLVWNNSLAWTSPRRHRRVAEVHPPPSCRRQYLAHAQSIATEPASIWSGHHHAQPKPSINHQHLQHLGWAIWLAVIPHSSTSETPPRMGAEPLELWTELSQTQTSRVMMIFPAVALVVVWRISSMNAFALAPD